ncbi:DMT family transporter [Thalassococcus sp. S3]|uniref:DMT family transporter n=1 Tax=Thalassococcus sp. S3 TaxID=2017482 RepID=UPI0010246880|nr:DMT family transporter [Thalassococcus sp. S3]QBF33330.1 EamA family transporter [Thalassococcus sp. S3]
MKQPENTDTLAVIATILAAGIWGLFWVPVRHFSAQGVNGEWAIVFLYLPAVFVLLPLVWRERQANMLYARKAWTIGALIGAGLALYGVALEYTTVVRATMLFYLTPVWATILGLWVLQERGNVARWGAIVCGLLGLFLLLDSKDGIAWNVGDALALASSIFWALGAIAIRQIPTIPLSGLSLAQFVCAPVFVVGIATLLHPLKLPSMEAVGGAMLILAAASILMVLPAIYALFWASQRLSPGRVGLLMMSEALVAVVTASIFLPEETLTITQWGGAALIIGSGLLELSGGRSI